MSIALVATYYVTIGLVYAYWRLSIRQATLRRRGMNPNPKWMKLAVALVVIGWPIGMARWAYVKVSRGMS